MKKNLVFILFMAVIFSCVSVGIPHKYSPENPRSRKKIMFYGSPRCGHCMYFSRKMQEDRIPFEFYDVKTDKERAREMWDKVKSVRGEVGSVNFPVMDVDGVIMIAPEYEEFKFVALK